MSSNVSTIDASILPVQARQELFDFYSFLLGKYVTHRERPHAPVVPATGTAATLAASPLVGMWKERTLGDSSVFARSLREQAQKRPLS